MRFPEFNRAAGVLLNVSSLPSEYGIGCFSKDADTFVDMAVDMGFHWWQVLPLTMLGWGNSPYSGLSAFAGNSLYICPNELVKKGLLYQEELGEFRYGGGPFATDYEFARQNSAKYLARAFGRVNAQIKAQIDEYRSQQSAWLEDYALFMALAKSRGTAWRKWEDDLKFRDASTLDKFRAELKDDIDYYVFEQYEFSCEWSQLKERANLRGVEIIGDISFYVSSDSVDVWAHPEFFCLDGRFDPKAIAGVPPDAFAAKGQIWGNCLYDFDAMKKDGYSWWRARVKRCFNLYDALRLDHFRAFYNYFSIPATDVDTAENGHWEQGPGAELLEYFCEDNPQCALIAEDLGLIDADCRRFIDSTEIPTMRVFQFGFDGTPSVHIPYRYDINCVAYTGTHDNNTTLGWLYDLNEDTRSYVLKYCGFSGAGWGAGGPGCESTKAIIKSVIASSASLAVLPVQDLLGYGSDTRMNIPGVAEGNWTYRLPYHLMTTVDRNFFLDLNKTYGRFGHGVNI